MQFPVSSGQHHRANESEWVPVERSKPSKKDTTEQSTPETSKNKTDTAVTTSQSKSKVNDDIPLPTTGTVFNKF